MSVRRKTTKLDANHREVVNGLWKVGACVGDLSEVGTGIVDLLVGFRGQVFLLEVKDGAKSPSRRRLTPAQEEFHDAMRDVGVTVHVVLTVDDALRAIGAMPRLPDVVNDMAEARRRWPDHHIIDVTTVCGPDEFIRGRPKS